MLLLIGAANGISGQCGTVVPDSHIKNPLIMEENTRDMIEYDLDRTLSVHVYIVANDFQSYNYSSADYLPIWTEAAPFFEPIGLSFEICFESFIPNYQYDFISAPGMTPSEGFRPEIHMSAEHYTSNVINVYYVERIEHPALPDVNGYAYFPGGRDIIVIEKEHTVITLVHEIGHFLGLYHTFESYLGMELVNGSNCSTTGDLLCDTPADINGSIDVSDCTYTDLTTDLNGDFYTPYLSNIMSYYVECASQFTNQQYNRMAWILINERNYLW